MLKFKPPSILPDYTEIRASCVSVLGRVSSTQPLQEQSLCENKGLRMLGKQMNNFSLQECLPLLFSLFVQLYKPSYGFS